MLTFEPTSHTYTWEGKTVPNVTRVLGPLTDYSMVKPEDLENARQKGVAVHKMVELWAKNDLAQLPAWMEPVLAQWEKFVSDTNLTVIESERKVYHKLYGYAGTFDLRVTMPRYKGHGVIDIKRSFMAGAAIGLQLAAYQEARNSEGYTRDTRIQWRGALKLREDGSYRYEPFEDSNDFNVFMAALTMHNWKRKLQ